MRIRGIRLVAFAVAAAVTLAGVAAASDGPPPLPRAASGVPVAVVARGVPLPTGIALGKGTIFVAAFGSEDGKTRGGLYAVERGAPRQLMPGSFIGITWKAGTLYAATVGNKGSTLYAMSGWNGKAFSSRKPLLHSRSSISGIAFGPDGRLYAAGGGDCDHCDLKRPFAQAVLSMRKDGTDRRVVAQGLRNPYGVAFAPGIARPFVTVEGQENLGKRQPPDYVVLAKPGEDYGFPRCNWSKPAACAAYAKPLVLLPAHSSPTGIAAVGKRLYMGMFNGTRGPAVWSIATSGGKPTEAVSGFPAPVVGVAASGHTLYVGDLTGTVYRIPVS